MNVTEVPVELSPFMAMQTFIVEPVATWTLEQALLFPWLFIIPAEILGMASSALIYFLGAQDKDLPYGKTTFNKLGWTDLSYIWFNRLVVLPFISWLVVTMVWNSDAVVFKPEDLTWANGLGAFLVVFACSDFTYYAGHRIVHSNVRA